MFNRLAQFRRIRTINQIRQFVNYLIWELDVIVHEQAQGDDYVDAEGKPYFKREEGRVYDAFMDQCWQVDACGLKEGRDSGNQSEDVAGVDKRR